MKRINQIEPWLGEEEKAELIATIDSGWFTEAERTRRFEQVFAQYVGSKYASAVNNGTITLFIACVAAGVGDGDEVIVPDFTMIASANAVKLARGEPVFVDIDRETLCLDLEATQRAITPRTKAIMPVLINGRYPDMARLNDMARKHNLYIIEDAAQALGSRYHGKHLGTLGHMGSFSFSTPKVITTGQGGMLVTDDANLYEKMLKIKDFGRRSHNEDYHTTMGYNFKFTDFQAAVGIAQMGKLEWRVNRKKDMFRLYYEQLKDIEGIRFLETSLDDTSPWFIDIIVSGGRRESLATHLKGKGIGTRAFYPSIHTQAPYNYVKGEFPNSQWASAEGLWLPSSSFLTDEDIEYVCHEIRNFYKV